MEGEGKKKNWSRWRIEGLNGVPGMKRTGGGIGQRRRKYLEMQHHHHVFYIGASCIFHSEHIKQMYHSQPHLHSYIRDMDPSNDMGLLTTKHYLRTLITR